MTNVIDNIIVVLLAVIRVANDHQLGTFKSGGVEILNVHTTHASGRQVVQQSPTLHSMDFISYDECPLASSQLDASVLEYAEVCRGFVLDHLHNLLSSNAGNGLCNIELIQCLVDSSSWSPPVSEKLTEYLDSPDSVALKTLQQIFAAAVDDAFAQNVDSLILTSWTDIISSDRLFSYARCDRCFRTCLDVVVENCEQDFSGSHIKLVECDAGTGQAYRHVMRQLASVPAVTVNYIAADPNPAQLLDAELVQKLGIATVDWSLDSTKPIPDQASVADVVILANVLHRHDNISAALSAASSLVRDDGFLLIVEPTSNFAIPWSFFALTHDVTKMSDLSSRTCGPFCDEATWTRLMTNAGLTPIAQKSDLVLHTVFLYRKLSSTSPTQAPKIIDVDDTSFDWLEEVKAVMADESESDAKCGVWLKASKVDSGVVGMINCLRREPNGNRLRYRTKVIACTLAKNFTADWTEL